MENSDLVHSIIDRLSTVMDPETGVDVMRMKLVLDLEVTESGNVSYRFRPSSPLCPIAVPLALGIIDAIKEVPGVKHQQVTVTDYVEADQLNEILKTILDEQE